ncbi:MAG: helix-turn-helix domain-containing protein [Pseudomonadota bacterium]
MSNSARVGKIDGRRLRSARSRQAILTAAVELVEEGSLVPTAQQIAERAGVGIRSFFRHFEEMESLFEALDLHLRDTYEAHFAHQFRCGTLEERIAGAVQAHADGYEKCRNLMLSAQALRWKSKVVRQNYARSQRLLRQELELWLPEIIEFPKDARETIDAVASFDMWHRLREHQRLSKKASNQLIESLLRDLVLAFAKR